jgi:hypothetical protein
MMEPVRWSLMVARPWWCMFVPMLSQRPIDTMFARLTAMVVLLCSGVMMVESVLHVHERHYVLQEQVEASHDHDAAADCELCKVTLAHAVAADPLHVEHVLDGGRVTPVLPRVEQTREPMTVAGPSRAPPRS